MIITVSKEQNHAGFLYTVHAGKWLDAFVYRGPEDDSQAIRDNIADSLTELAAAIRRHGLYPPTGTPA